MVHPQIVGDDQDNDRMLGFWNISEKNQKLLRVEGNPYKRITCCIPLYAGYPINQRLGLCNGNYFTF